MQLVYKITSPPLNFFLKQSILNIEDHDLNENSLIFRWTDDVFIEQKFCDIKFTSVLYLMKKQMRGIIHADKFGPEQFQWGINFNLVGNSILKYWNYENVILKNSGSTMNDTTVNYPVYETNAQPDYQYTLEENCAYLVNANVPHCGESLELKKTYSLRTNLQEKNKHGLHDWSSVVNHFKRVILHDI